MIRSSYSAVIIAVTLAFGSTAQAMPDLYVRPFKDLNFPPQLSKTEIQFALNRASEEMYGTAFARIGTIADFMHGHLILRPFDRNEPQPDLQMTDISWSPDWSHFESLAILFHSQEELSQEWPQASFKLDPNNRNWLLWLKDQAEKRRGDMARAEDYQKPTAIYPSTVSSDELDVRRFGEHAGDFEYSFYFFRVSCEQVDSVSNAFGSETNLMQVAVGSENVCLALVSFHCRLDYNSQNQECRGSQKLTPYYQPATS